jgi:hypothetical protein
VKITGSDVFWWVVLAVWLITCVVGVVVMAVKHG